MIRHRCILGWELKNEKRRPINIDHLRVCARGCHHYIPSTATMSKAMTGSEESLMPPSQVSVTESCNVLGVSVVVDEFVALAVEDDAQSSKLGTINSISVFLRTRGVTTFGLRILLSPNDEHTMITCTPAVVFHS